MAKDQLKLSGKWKFADERKDSDSSAKIQADGEYVIATAGGTKAVFSRTSGTLKELVMDGKSILRDSVDEIIVGPRLTCGRAFTDNDRWMRDGNPWREDRKRVVIIQQVFHS